MPDNPKPVTHGPIWDDFIARYEAEFSIEKRDLSRFDQLLAEALHAFRTDYGYAVAIAEAYHKLMLQRALVPSRQHQHTVTGYISAPDCAECKQLWESASQPRRTRAKAAWKRYRRTSELPPHV